MKIDKDCFVDKGWLADYIDAVITICRLKGVEARRIRICCSRRKGLHFYVDINPPVESHIANLLQWLLGDDSQRVDFNRARIDSGLARWNLLFEVAGRQLRTIYDVRVPAGTRRKLGRR